MALCSIDDIKTILGITDTSQDALLTIFRDAAQGAIKRYLHSNVEQATYTNFFSGDGQSDLVLKQRPVTSITSIHVDQNGYFGQGAGAFPATTQMTQGADFALVIDSSDGTSSRSGMVRRIGAGDSNWYNYFATTTISGGPRGAVWPKGTGNIKVVYVAGYSVVPNEIQLACVNLTILAYNNRAKAGQQIGSESLGSYSYSLLSSGGAGGKTNSGAAELGSIRQMLAPYREVSL